MTPCLRIDSIQSSHAPITTPIMKFGGQPVWLGSPQWPISKGWADRPMMFLCQVPLEKPLFACEPFRMGYVFVTHPESPDDHFFDPDVCDPDEGENAVIIQPGRKARVETRFMERGPALFDASGKPFEGTPTLMPDEDPEFIDDASYRKLPEREQTRYFESVDGSKVGGVPAFSEDDQWPAGDDWRLLLQLRANFQPFYLNLGASPMLFSFVSSDLTEGRALVQGM